MREKIGKVALDYSFYPGTDLYSDGQVEEELLEIAKNYSRKEFNRIINEREKWPLLYHFSHIRENIVSWLPITRNDHVLEIGSGCGAVTGALARKAGQVTCVDLSKRRSLVNAYRNKDFDNINILVGNFQDIEKNLTETYDYITRIGVFEYSEGYIGTENPYVDMLKIIAAHLKPQGKIIIAIENKLGLKYWAGCTEDHTGLYFEGLEGYPRSKGVRTFTRRELEKIFQDAGLGNGEFYYPYPDYKFPMAIFSDRWLPAEGDLKEINYNYDRERVRLFNETNVYNTILREGLFPLYTNSYLTVLRKKDVQENTDCIYVKYSNERSENFAIRTEIYEDPEGKRKVYKVADCPEGEIHLKNIQEACKKLEAVYQDTPIRLNQCMPAEKGIELEYITGRTLENVLDEMLKEKREDRLKDTFKKYLDTLRQAGTVHFSMTEEFKKVFGNAEIPESELCPEYINLDPVCGNILWADKEWVMLDYEWSFSFPVPVRYQIYRVIKYYLYTSTARGKLHSMGLFQEYGIDEKKMEIYEKMEKNFQKYILGEHIPMRDMYDRISPGTLLDIHGTDFLGKLHNRETFRVYLDWGTDFREEQSFSFRRNETKIVKRIKIPAGVTRIRMDPCEQACMAKMIRLWAEISDETTQELKYEANGFPIWEGFYAFKTADPYFISGKLPDGTKAVWLEMHIYPCYEEIGGFLEESGKIMKEKEQQQEEINQLRKKLEKAVQRIQSMENTKIWKLYKTVKRD